MMPRKPTPKPSAPEPNAPEIARFRAALAEARRGALAQLRDYLAHTGLSAERAAQADAWAETDGMLVPDVTLPAVRVERYHALAPVYDAALAVFTAHGTAMPDAAHVMDLPDPTDTLSPGEIADIQAAYDACRGPGRQPPTFGDVLARVPAFASLVAEVDAIAREAAEGTARVRGAKLAELLRAPDGSTFPTPSEWITTRAPQIAPSLRRYAIRIALRHLERETSEHAGDVDEIDPEAEDDSPAHGLGVMLRQLGDRVVFPRPLIEAGYADGAGLARKLARVETQLDLLAGNPETVDVLRAGAEIVAERTQLGNLGPTEVRALCAVFRIFSTVGDNGRNFAAPGGRAQIPARLFYRGADVDPHNGARCRALFQATDALASREIFAAIIARDPKGGKDAPEYVYGERTRLFTFRPVWERNVTDGRKRREESGAEIAQRWAARSLAPGEPWDGPLPDFYAFELPPIMRKVWHNLTLGGDVLARLDAGAKEVRGPRQSFEGLEWRLLVEITQREQRGGLSYVDRDKLLADFYGLTPADVKRHKARGKWTERYVAQYEKAVAVLAHGGGRPIAWRVERDHAVKRGQLRDVFRADTGTAAAAASADPDAPTLALAAGDGGGRRTRRRKR